MAMGKTYEGGLGEGHCWGLFGLCWPMVLALRELRVVVASRRPRQSISRVTSFTSAIGRAWGSDTNYAENKRRASIQSPEAQTFSTIIQLNRISIGKKTHDRYHRHAWPWKARPIARTCLDRTLEIPEEQEGR
jgi:hypothetical protein